MRYLLLALVLMLAGCNTTLGVNGAGGAGCTVLGFGNWTGACTARYP